MRNRVVLLLIVVAGAYLRLHNLDWGLPEVFEEATPWRQAWGMWGFHTGKLDFNPHFFNYPAFTFYVQWIGQSLIYVFGRVSGIFSSRLDMLTSFEADPSRFYIVGRAITSLFGVASVYLLYRLGRDIFSGGAGLVAAFFLALNFSHIRRGQLITTDVPLVFFVLLAYVFIWKIATQGRCRHYVWAGACVGLATGVKYPGLLLAAGIVAAHLYHHHVQKHTWRRVILHRYLWMSAGAVAVVFFLISPYCFLDYSGFYRDFHFEQTHMKIGHFGTPERALSYGKYLLAIVPRTLTLPLAMLAVGGLGYGIMRYRGFSVIFLPFPLIYFAIVGSWKTAADHYVLPFIPLLLLLGAVLVWDVFAKIRGPGSQALVAVAVSLLVLPSALRIHDFAVRPDIQDNRTVAREWIGGNIKKGSAIAKEEYTPDLSPGEYLVFDLPMSSLYPAGTQPFYDLLWYVDFDYIIISSEVYQRYKNEPGNYQVHVRFYEQLDRCCTLVKDFDDMTGSGPRIKIYQVAKPAGGAGDEDFPSEVFRLLAGTAEPETNSRILTNLANVLSQRHRYSKAMRLYHLAIALDSTSTKAWYNMGLTLGNQGALEESREALAQAVRLDSAYANAWFGLGHLHSQTGDLRLSIDAYERGLLHDPYRLDVFRILNDLYIREGMIAKAISVAQRGLDLSGKSAEFRFILGRTYLAEGAYEQAVESLERALELRPSNGKYAYHLAVAYYYQKDYATAAEFARRAEEMGYDTQDLTDMLKKALPSDPP